MVFAKFFECSTLNIQGAESPFLNWRMVYVGIDELFYGGSMWLGCYSRIKKLVVYFCIVQLICSSAFVYANPAVALAVRPLLSRVFTQVVTKRAALVAANDATFTRLATTQTFRAVGKIAVNDAKFALGATSSLRHAKDISWVHLALASGVISLSDLNTPENENIGISFEPTAIKLSDGRYAIQVNGETKIVNAQPSLQDPIIYRYSKEKNQFSGNVDDIYKSDVLSNQYKYFGTLITGEYAQSNSIQKLSEYISQENFGGKGEETYREVDINGKKYKYLSSKTDVVNTYLRHKQIGTTIYPEVRQNFTDKRLRYDFEAVSSAFTGKSWVYSFNKPDETDYEISTRVRNVTYISFAENENFIGDFPVTTPQEEELGSISDIDSGLFSARPLTAEQVANMYNAMLLSAVTQADYQGLPFNSANPITATEVRTALNELALSNPTLADLFTKAGTGDQLDFDVNVNVVPDTSVTSNTGNNTNNEQEDYGSPEYPELEMPTAEEILDPFKKFFPTLQNFKLKGQSATCPTWSFDIWNKHFTIDSHCGLLEEQRQLIQTIFSILWAFIALRHLLTA